MTVRWRGADAAQEQWLLAQAGSLYSKSELLFLFYQLKAVWTFSSDLIYKDRGSLDHVFVWHGAEQVRGCWVQMNFLCLRAELSLHLNTPHPCRCCTDLSAKWSLLEYKQNQVQLQFQLLRNTFLWVWHHQLLVMWGVCIQTWQDDAQLMCS